MNAIGALSALRQPMVQPACLVVIEDPTLRTAVANAIASNGYRVHPAKTPLEAVHVMERHGVGIHYVVLTVSSADGVAAWLAEEYPTIESVMLLCDNAPSPRAL